MKYFTIKELCKTNTGYDNIAPKDVERNLTLLIDEVLDFIREAFGEPIIVNSGYRSEKVNKAVGGAKTSQHLTGEAVDISCKNKKDNKMLFDLILSMQMQGTIEFDQLIDERKYSWIHISYKKTGNRNQILHLK